MRCNLICVEGDLLKNHSAGHISTGEADVLIRFLNEKLATDRIRFYTGVQYRHLLVIKGETNGWPVCLRMMCPCSLCPSSGEGGMCGSSVYGRPAECTDPEIAEVAVDASAEPGA